MGRLGSNYRNARSTSKKEKKLEKSHSSPTKDLNKLAQMNSKIEKEAKNNLNEIDSFDNLFSANNNFLSDLCFDQSVKHGKQNNELSGWQDTETARKQLRLFASAQKGSADGEQLEKSRRLDKVNYNLNDQSNITERRTQRAVSANICAGQTPLISGRKGGKFNEQNTYNSAQKQSKNMIGSHISPIAYIEQSTEKKNNSFSSPQVLLSNLIGSNYRASATPKVASDQSVSQFDVGGIVSKQKDVTPAVLMQNQYSGHNLSTQFNPLTAFNSSSGQNQYKNSEDAQNNTVSQWKTYLNRYDSSQDLYNVNPGKKRLSALQSFDSQKDEDQKFVDYQIESDDDDNNGMLLSFNKQESQKAKIKNANLSIDISSIRIAAGNQIEDQKVNQNHQFQVNQSSNFSQQKDLSSRQTYRTSKSSQANRIFGKKKKRLVNMSALQTSNNNNLNVQQYQQQVNKNLATGIKDTRQRTICNNLMNSEENCKSSSSSLSGQNNKFNIKNYQKGNQSNDIANENVQLLQLINSNQSSQQGIKQLKRTNCNYSMLEEQQQYATVNQNLSISYQPYEFLSQKNTLAYFVQSNQNTTPQNRFLENQDLKNIFQQILVKSKEEKDAVICNKSQILKSISSYQPKRSLNNNSINAAQQLGKEKIKQVIQQKNNQRILRQIQTNGNIGGTQSLNNSVNVGYQHISSNINNKSVICDTGNFKIMRNSNNSDLNKDDYIIRNAETNEKFAIHIPHRIQNQSTVYQTTKKTDENSYQNIKRIRAKSILKSDDLSNQNEQPHLLKKQSMENNQIKPLKPSVLNIVANENNGLVNKAAPLLQNSYSIRLSEKFIPLNQSLINRQDKNSINNKIYNTGVYSNLLTKF